MATFNYTSASSVQQANYAMISNGTAFDTSPAQYAAMLGQAVANLEAALTILTGTSSAPTQLADTVTMLQNLVAHLNNQYESLIDNLGLVTSGIADAVGYNVLGTPGAPSGSITNPTASLPSFFGSIMGSSNAYVGQIANLIVGVAQIASVMLAGAVIAHLSTSTDASIIAALGPFTDVNALASVLQNTTPEGLAQIGQVMNNLGALFSAATTDSTFATSPEIAELAAVFGVTGPSNS